MVSDVNNLHATAKGIHSQTSSDPDTSTSLNKKDGNQSYQFPTRIGRNHYKRELNGQIYHSSCWSNGEISGSREVKEARSSKRHRRENDSIISTRDFRSDDREEIEAETWNRNVYLKPRTSAETNKYEDDVWNPP